VLHKLVSAGNNVLVTTKPHLDAIKQICKRMEAFKDLIQFRFTITSMDNNKLAYWEPGAPKFEERLRSLEFASLAGFKTSVSIEPILDPSVSDVIALYETLFVHSMGSIWLGIMNHVKDGGKIDVHELHRKLKSAPLVKFKDSIKNALER